MYSAPEVFPFSELLSDDTFDIRLEGQSFLSEHTNCGPPIPPPLLKSDEFAGLKNAMLCGQESWVQDISGKLPTNNKPTTGKIKISNNFPAPQTIISPSQSPSITPEKKIIEKEKHKERQRQRRQKMTDTMSRLKSMIPECVKREEEASLEGKKKQKVDQNQLLEMTVDYIQVLKNRISQLEHENNVLRTYVETNNSDLSSDILSDLSSSPDSSPQSSNDEPIYFNSLLDNHTPLIGKRNLSNLYQGEMEIAKSAKQPRLVRAARVLMAVFVVGLIYYNPVSFPTVHSSSPSVGSRVLQSTSALSYLGQAPEYLSNLIVFVLSSVVAKIIMVMFWTFAAMLLDHIYVPSSELVKLARQENDIGVKKYDKGDYQGSRRHFEKAMIYLGRSPRASIFTRIFHIPLELWRQVLHLLRFGLWCDGFLVHLHGGQEAWLETARCNHYLFSLNVLANNLDSQSVLYFLVSLNTAESLFQKPPVLAEVYATIAIAFYGLLRMPKVYQYMMGKAWNVVENFPEEEDKRNDSAVDNTKAYLLFLSSYGSLCDGDLQQVQAQIQRGCDLFLKKGNKNMFFQGQFVISYTHFLRGNYFTTMQIMKNIEVCNLGDPRISWWREVLIIGCKLCLYDSVSERDLCHLENLYSKVESHSTFAPTLAVLQQSILALLLLRLDYKDRAIEVAMDALTNFEDSTFTGYIFYCSYYIAEVFFTIWEEEKQNTALTNQLSRLTHRLCTCLRRVAKVCELGKPIALLVIGRYTLNMKEYSRAIDYLKKAVEASEHCSIESYKVQATWLISRAEHELTAKEFSV